MLNSSHFCQQGAEVCAPLSHRSISRPYKGLLLCQGESNGHKTVVVFSPKIAVIHN